MIKIIFGHIFYDFTYIDKIENSSGSLREATVVKNPETEAFWTLSLNYFRGLLNV